MTLLLVDMDSDLIPLTAELSVSRSLPLSCYDVARLLSKSGIMANVTANVTTQPSIERGCRIVQPISDKKEVESTWKILKNEYSFRCAYLKIDGVYAGCVLDYLRPSLCGRGAGASP